MMNKMKLLDVNHVVTLTVTNANILWDLYNVPAPVTLTTTPITTVKPALNLTSKMTKTNAKVPKKSLFF